MAKKLQLRGSLAEQAYTRILDQVLKGQYPLGAALSRRRLATEFGMSFLPISEAIKRLEREGLVESRPRVGTRVRIPTATDLRDRQIIREALEAQSARLFAEKASADERAELRAMAEHLDALTDRVAGGESDPDFLFETQMYHLSFHMRVAECTGCSALRDMLAQNQVLIFNWLYDVASDHRMPRQWHQQLAEQLSTTDPEAAEAAMRGHVRYAIEDIQAKIVRRFGGVVTGLEGISRPGTWRLKARAAR